MALRKGQQSVRSCNQIPIHHRQLIGKLKKTLPLFSHLSTFASCLYIGLAVISGLLVLYNLLTTLELITTPNMAKNYTIDDSQWSTSALSLSPGWNMLRSGGSNEYISETQMAAMMPHLGEFWNSSVSWTTSPGSSTTLSFIGNKIWAYGIAGPDQGSFSASIDNKTIGTYSAQQNSVDYKKLLFQAIDLSDGMPHTLTLTNVGNHSFAFDYALIQSTSLWQNSSASVPSTPSAATQATGDAAAGSSLPSTSDSEMKAALSRYSPSQLAALSQTYHAKWTGALYFVVILSSLFGAAILAWLIYTLSKKWARNPRNNVGSEGTDSGFRLAGKSKGKSKSKTKGRQVPSDDGHSYLIHETKGWKRSTKLLDALKGKKISPPISGDNGSITTGGSGRRESVGTVESYPGAKSHDTAEKGTVW
ncbi:hypothetical protein L204_100204 [Cryptococcus depauperatus]